MTLRRLLGLLLSFALARPVFAAEFRLGQPTMGTVLQVTVLAADEAQAKKLADDCLRAARHWDEVLTTWRPEGELEQLNRRAGKGPASISADLAGSLRQMLSLSAATSGAFDPSVGSWVDWWRTPNQDAPRRAEVPQLAKALQLDGTSATLAEGVRLDAGAIGKGIALDVMAARLRDGGASAAFIDFGGSGLYALGAPPDSPDGWPVAIAGVGAGEVHGVIALRDASLSTSRSGGVGDAAGSIVDPRSGRPVEAGRVAVVLSGDAAAADAWSTALVVLGASGLEQAAKARVDAMVQDQRGTAMTPGFGEKLRKGT